LALAATQRAAPMPDALVLPPNIPHAAWVTATVRTANKILGDIALLL
jgi:hypothetical protein